MTKRREIQMEFDQFEDVENFHGRFIHEPGTWGATGWAFDKGTADDIMSDWEHDMKGRAYDRHGVVFFLAETGPDGAPVIGKWSPRREEANGEPFWFLADFPFQQTFRVTTDPPPAPKKVDEPSTEQFANFGRKVAALFASSAEWDDDTTGDVGSIARNVLDITVGDDMDEGTWLMWEKIAQGYGYEMWEHEGDD